MQIGINGLNLIKEFEGFVGKPYKDVVGIWTIGYGFTIIDGVRVTAKTEHMSEAEASDILLDELVQYENAINRLVKVELSQNQFDALVCFTFNVGIGAFSSSTLLRLLNKGDYASVPAQLMRWNKAGGKVVSGLTRRRKAEGDLFNS